MANIILPAVPVLNEIDDSTKLLIEQAGEINRYPISNLDIGIDIDESLSAISINPVQNKVINDAIQKLTNNKSDTVQITNGNTIYLNNSAYTPLKGLRIFGKTTQNGTPTPEAPVPLESVGESVNVIVHGKNLWPHGDIKGEANVSVNGLALMLPPGRYSFSRKTANCDITFRFFTSPNLTDTAESFTQRSSMEHTTFETSKTIYGANYFISSSTGVADTNVQLEIGSTVTEYKPYTEQTITISTPNGLPGIPVSSGGNYTDENGQQWVCDEVDFEKGKYIQRIGIVDFGTLTWQTWTDRVFATTNVKTEINAPTDNMVTAHALCSGFVVDSYFHTVTEQAVTAVSVSDSGTIAIHTDTSMDAATFNELVQGIIFCFELATPIEAPLYAEELAQYAALHTNYPNTTVFNDSGAGMEVKYYTPTTAVQMVHSPNDEGKVLAIDEHGCVVLTGDIGGGDITIEIDPSSKEKPQSPLYSTSNDTHFYPLTTADQVILDDGNRLDDEISKYLTVELEGEAAEPNGINADTLGGYAADEYVRKDQYGIELNYSVVGSMEEPMNPTQNMIWIQTETPIGRVFFGNDEPNETFIEGDVWIRTGNSSSVLFNSLKIGNSYVDMVHPLSVKQYVDGIWIDEEAMSYQNGEWVEWAIYVLTLFNSFTTVRENGTGSVIIDNGTVTATTTGTASNVQGNVMYFSDKIIDLSEYKTLSFHVKNSGKKYTNIGFYSANTDKYSWNNKVAVHEIYDSSTNDYEQDVTVDLSNVNSLCYFAIGMSGYLSGAGANIVVVSNIKLMK